VLASMLALADWGQLRVERRRAIEMGIRGVAGRGDAASAFLDLVADGLAARDLGEERLLAPAYERLAAMTGPADDARELHEAGGIEALVRARAYASATSPAATK
jgi:hypothetical protein